MKVLEAELNAAQESNQKLVQLFAFHIPRACRRDPAPDECRVRMSSEILLKIAPGIDSDIAAVLGSGSSIAQVERMFATSLISGSLLVDVLPAGDISSKPDPASPPRSFTPEAAPAITLDPFMTKARASELLGESQLFGAALQVKIKGESAKYFTSSFSPDVSFRLNLISALLQSN